MKRNALLVVIPLMIALTAACSTSTESGGTRYTFSWAYDIALEYLENNWDGWEETSALIAYACMDADENCELGRPLSDAYWRITCQNSAYVVFQTDIDSSGEVFRTNEFEAGVPLDPVEEQSDAKLAEMMAFCLDEDNVFWRETERRPEEFSWDAFCTAQGYDQDVFENYYVDLETGEAFGYLDIAVSGSGDDYEILDYYFY
ncbi:MAG: hypothetical protein GF403_10960 [Candidatus Coatesbacteria bacterium]|nr:hypothetical protein [Candidatus Coatesbacteria bacterium]